MKTATFSTGLVGTILILLSNDQNRADTILITNWKKSWAESGLWVYVDRSANNLFDGEWKQVKSPKINIGDCNSTTDIIIWGPRIKPQRQSINFMPNVDVKHISVDTAPIVIPTVVWVRAEVESLIRAKIPKDIDSINSVFKQESAGIQLSLNSSNIKRCTSLTPNTIKWNERSKSVLDDLQRDGVLAMDTLNIYFIYGRGNQARGWAVYGGNAILLFSTASWKVLLHEIGHCFGLEHTHVSSDLAHMKMSLADETNVMAEFSNKRRHFTDGQILAIHYTFDSWLNRGNNKYPIIAYGDRIAPLDLCLWDSLSYKFDSN